MKTRILSLLVCVVLLLSVLPTVAVLAATPISYANLNGFSIPYVGQSSANNLKNLSVPAGAHYSIAAAYWVDNAGNKALYATDVFESGHSYFLSISLKPEAGYSMNSAKPQFNGAQKYADISAMLDNGYYWLRSINFTPAAVSNVVNLSTVNLNGFAAPIAGQTVGENLKNVSVPDGAHYSITEISWYDRTNPKLLSASDVLQTGHVYMLRAFLSPDPGYSLEGAVPQLNGSTKDANVESVLMSNGSLLFYSVNFDLTVYSKIRMTNVIGFAVPYAKQSTANNLKDLKTVSDAKYQITDVCWIEKEGNRELKGTDTFAPGHTYYLRVDLTPDEGYTLVDATPLLNGSQVFVDVDYTWTSGGCLFFYSVDFTIPEDALLSTANVAGFSSPALGQTVRNNLRNLSVPSGAHYSIFDAFWIDKEGGRKLDDDDIFEPGHTYYLRVDLKPNEGYTLVDASPLLGGSVDSVDAEFTWMSENVLVFYSLDFDVSECAAKKGDINGDGVLNAFDYQMVKAYVLGTYSAASDAQKATMDVTGDGIVNAFDYQMLKAAVLGTYHFA